jgi:hypothetical protein
MSFSAIQRRALCMALITLAGVATVVLCYWSAVKKGALPSPLQPVLRSHSPAVETKPAMVHARAVPPPSPRPAPEFAPAKSAEAITPEPVQAAQPKSVPAPVRSESQSLSLASPETNRVVASLEPPAVPAPAPEPPRKPEPAQPAQPDAQDQALAERWLANTNQRPVVRVHYDVAELLQLVAMRRGLLVASGTVQAHPRELYLQSKPDAPPLFAPYTQSVANEFSTYSLRLDASPALTPLRAPFPAYFPETPVTLSFVPDHALATEIFAQVARAQRSGAAELSPNRQTIYEGQLTLQNSQPEFRLLEVRSGSRRVPFGASDGLTPALP